MEFANIQASPPPPHFQAGATLVRSVNGSLPHKPFVATLLCKTVRRPSFVTVTPQEL